MVIIPVRHDLVKAGDNGEMTKPLRHKSGGASCFSQLTSPVGEVYNATGAVDCGTR